MPEVHFLTVGEGDCTLIRHSSGRVSMIDICGGNRARKSQEELRRAMLIESLQLARGNPLGNYRMCENPTHPLDYIQDRSLHPIYRFISTHPDMDHLDGFKALLDTFAVHNFWHTGAEKQKPEFDKSPYSEADWDAYKKVQRGDVSGTKSLEKLDGATFEFANKGGDGDRGDCLHIAAPSAGLVSQANNEQEFNDSSYIIVYRMQGGKIVICGDAEDGAFNHAIEKYPRLMEDVGILLAPHHGRDSGRDYGFLDHLNPRFTLLGCAPHEHHRTSSWTSRGLAYCKQNQCGNMIAVPSREDGRIDLYIQSKSFAENSGGDSNRTYVEGMYFFKTV